MRNVLTVTCVAVGVVTVEDPVEIDEPPGPTPFTDESLAATAVPEADDPVEVGAVVELELALLGDPIVTAEVALSVVVVLLPYPAVPESPASPPGPVLLPAVELLPEATASEGAKNIKNCSYIE